MQSIFNRPPSIAKDTVYYALYPPELSSNRSSATALLLSVQNFVESFLTDFLWHRDAFQLKVVQNNDRSGWFLEGRMRVGDSIDDEWCVVWLLHEVSKKWDFAISIHDSDGEFMLIEAADTLPSWVTPSVVENRVWIYKSHLHLIPLSHVSSPSSGRPHVGVPTEDLTSSNDYLNISDALKLIRDISADTKASVHVEQTLWQRIERYPNGLSFHVHKTKAYLPIDIAKALSVNPALIQKAIEIFYTRDAVQLRAAHKMTRFPPQPCVLRTVRLSRTAYAQSVGQRFHPPKVFGRSWQVNEGNPEWKWRDLGLKISCGFEMLYQEGGSREEKLNTSLDGLNTAVQARRDAVQRDPEYAKYIKCIQVAGYFRDEIEGSRLWNELENKALVVFLQSQREDHTHRPSFASQVNAAVAKAEVLEPSSDLEDSDDWLTVSAEDFDTVLQEQTRQYASRTSHVMDVDDAPRLGDEENDVTNTQVAKLRDLANKVDAFVAGKGDVEGAIFKDEQSSGEETGDFSDEGFSDSGAESGDEEESASAARQTALENLVPGIESSEYGRMPASFYEHSQRVAATCGEVSTSVTDNSLPHVRSQPVRAPIIPRDRYEGVDSDDDSEDEDEPVDEEDEEEQPQLVGDVEVDMAEEEEEFLEFSRQTLGISDEHWREILQERRGRGAFVPTYVTEESRHSFMKDSAHKTAISDAPESVPHLQRTGASPNLDSFEAVMRAMDEELARSQSHNALASSSNPSPRDKAESVSVGGVDIELAMDAELKAALDQDEDDGIDLDAAGSIDYNLIKNFLESFKSQAGLSGPVSNLAGRLQPSWGLPRDDSG
ncbi:SGT1 protein-domain-containing protein [Multifurca ochricompacta]|uniref:SGT1 protein-domain-containing protein n=1 Tax=Multifurca ochricompacta TaxID=376703 RepID=A0AAD4MG81_9AGAM|nr:SGT1 protein-domain-containing protein [Multifurca ochricompacta]